MDILQGFELGNVSSDLHFRWLIPCSIKNGLEGSQTRGREPNEKAVPVIEARINRGLGSWCQRARDMWADLTDI